MDNCIFCKIIAKEIQAHVLYEDDDILVILDKDPISEGHTLILPKENIHNIYELTEKLGSKIMIMAKKIAHVIKNNFKFDGVMLMQVNGEFQDVPHYHMHVFGRKKENDIKIHYPSGIIADYSHLSENALMLKKSLSELIN